MMNYAIERTSRIERAFTPEEGNTRTRSRLSHEHQQKMINKTTGYDGQEAKNSRGERGAVATVLEQLSTNSQKSHEEMLTEIDALVGIHVTKVSPSVFWTFGDEELRFDTVEDAMESLRDPLIREFLPHWSINSAVLREVREFPAYSRDFSQTSAVIMALGNLGLTLAYGGRSWNARFGDFPAADAVSAPLAICLAALKASGVPTL